METPDPFFEKPASSQTPPSADLLAAMYQHAPVMVIVLTTDGVVLHSNAATERVTGYSERDLQGKNFWALLFPGRLFKQVPRFISTIHPAQVVGKDVAMMLRTRDGKERTVAWTRVMHEDGAGGQRMVCFGADLTDRLVDADITDDGTLPMDAGSAGVEGEVITPIAISPPILPTDGTTGGGAAIQQVHEFLMEIDGRMEALSSAFSRGEIDGVAGIAVGLRDGARACGLLDFSARVEKLHVAASTGAIEHVSGLMEQIVKMCRPGRDAKA